MCAGCHLEIVPRVAKRFFFMKRGATKGLDLKNNTTATSMKGGQIKSRGERHPLNETQVWYMYLSLGQPWDNQTHCKICLLYTHKCLIGVILVYVLRFLATYAILKLRCANLRLPNCVPISKLRTQFRNCATRTSAQIRNDCLYSVETMTASSKYLL